MTSSRPGHLQIGIYLPAQSPLFVYCTFDDVPDPAVAEDVREPERAIRRDDDALPAPDAATPPSDTDDPGRWNALAEEIRMQVLQRIDIFTVSARRTDRVSIRCIVDRHGR